MQTASMPRQAKDRTTVVLAVRVPESLAEAAYARCGGKSALAEWLRNLIRHGCGIKIDAVAGYDEGFRSGWSEANKKFRDAIKKTIS